MTTATISFLSVVVITPSQRGCNGCQTLSSTKSSSVIFRRISLCSSTSSSNPAIVEQESSSPPPESTAPLDPDALPPTRGCEACGREELENGCNGEGRIQGGIATVPGFGWWPIKAFRPCPGFVASGGRYRRRGQSMDEVVSGSGGKAVSLGTNIEAKSRAVDPWRQQEPPVPFVESLRGAKRIKEQGNSRSSFFAGSFVALFCQLGIALL